MVYLILTVFNVLIHHMEDMILNLLRILGFLRVSSGFTMLQQLSTNYGNKSH